MSVTVRILCTWLLWQWQVWLVWLFLGVCRPDEQSPNHVLIWLVLWFHLGFSCELSWVSKKLLTGLIFVTWRICSWCFVQLPASSSMHCCSVWIVANSMAAAFLSLFWFCDKMSGWAGIISYTEMQMSLLASCRAPVQLIINWEMFYHK